jgi:hypothetical protein
MGKSLLHYQWSAKRSVQIILILSLALTAIPAPLTSSMVQHHPITRADLHQIIALNHPQPELIKAVITVESEWNPKAISSKGAIGLMQVMPSSSRLSRTDLFCPEKNIQEGCRILKDFQRRTKTLSRALHLYSGGASGYAEKVMRRMKG